ncbi:vWA domain-containing protein [Pedobacter ginsengisoli]|uniref:vWA domain-containing protein n=1 Tax=Pedobacter ginsengisoli TaxID=363852 RepID=UPI0025501B06|nr:von Willebrand factor type A domain-containing protein [Pedobacter ginsengisoli]
MKRLILSVCMLLILAAFKAVEYNPITITGIVTDQSSGAPLPNAGIYVPVAPDKPMKNAGVTGQNGKYKITVPSGTKELTFTAIGYHTKKVKITGRVIDVVLTAVQNELDDVVIRGYQKRVKEKTTGSSYIVTGKEVRDVPVANVEQLVQGKVAGLNIQNNTGAPGQRGSISIRGLSSVSQNDESYTAKIENGFKNALNHPLSTFSVDVDAASYSNLRRFINNGGLPPADAVRIEEMINYFDYDYAQPEGDDPVNISTEISSAPWNTSHKLVKIGLQGKKITTDRLPASNLVFLIDVSGSMNHPNKLPLLVSSFKLLTEQLRSSDKVAIVVYAGQAGMVLPSTPGDQKIKIKEALNQLSAGGSTAGGQGIELAYKIASDNFIKNGNNRVILATDGDFNVGPNSDDAMQKLIENKRKSGIFLTVLGYGMGNIKDSKMEILADKGNGNYAYIDNISEARKVLISEFGGTLFTIAKDVKLQVEFNPAKVQAYRLVGYENRMLKARDFNDDLKDAGEMGAGHTVTALYEVIPVGVKSSFSGSVDDLKYQSEKKPVVRNNSRELLTVKMRYKKPDGNVSKLIVHPVTDHMQPFGRTSENFRFSAAVAEFGMLLRQSDFKQNASFDHVISSAQNAIGKDNEGYRAEFVKLAKSAKLLARELLTIEQTNKIDEKN